MNETVAGKQMDEQMQIDVRFESNKDKIEICYEKMKILFLN